MSKFNINGKLSDMTDEIKLGDSQREFLEKLLDDDSFPTMLDGNIIGVLRDGYYSKKQQEAFNTYMIPRWKKHLEDSKNNTSTY